METLVALLTSLTLSAAPTSPTDSVRLALWLTDPIGATSDIRCSLQVLATTSPQLPKTRPTLTEHDVTAWNAKNGRWTLNPARFSGVKAAQELQDHCFVLAINGKLVSSGVVLSSSSERLARFPTLSVSIRKESLELQLISSFRDGHSRPIYVDELNGALGRLANIEK